MATDSQNENPAQETSLERKINKHGHESWYLSLPPLPNNNEHAVDSKQICYELDVDSWWI